MKKIKIFWFWGFGAGKKDDGTGEDGCVGFSPVCFWGTGEKRGRRWQDGRVEGFSRTEEPGDGAGVGLTLFYVSRSLLLIFVID
jgi:hypothetical protein